VEELTYGLVSTRFYGCRPPSLHEQLALVGLGMALRGSQSPESSLWSLVKFSLVLGFVFMSYLQHALNKVSGRKSKDKTISLVKYGLRCGMYTHFAGCR
jgi:hypothetical protein